MIAAIYARLAGTRARAFVVGVVVGAIVGSLIGVRLDLGARSEARRICMQQVAQKLSMVTPDMLVKMCR